MRMPSDSSVWAFREEKGRRREGEKQETAGRAPEGPCLLIIRTHRHGSCDTDPRRPSQGGILVERILGDWMEPPLVENAMRREKTMERLWEIEV